MRRSGQRKGLLKKVRLGGWKMCCLVIGAQMPSLRTQLCGEIRMFEAWLCSGGLSSLGSDTA